jgi:hypothetical protein
MLSECWVEHFPTTACAVITSAGTSSHEDCEVWKAHHNLVVGPEVMLEKGMSWRAEAPPLTRSLRRSAPAGDESGGSPMQGPSEVTEVKYVPWLARRIPFAVRYARRSGFQVRFIMVSGIGPSSRHSSCQVPAAGHCHEATRSAPQLSSLD